MDRIEFKCKWLELDEIWGCAEDFRDKYWPERKPPVDVERIVEFKLRLDIEPVHGLMQTTDMEAYLRAGLTGIVVDHDRYMEEKFINRMRFSFAHELGHLFLHKEMYKTIRFESAEEWKEIIRNASDEDYGRFEYQANEFAGRLLVPRKNLVHEIENAMERLKRHKLIDYMKGDPYAVLSGISPALARFFGVSTDVIERRVEREKLWPPSI